MSEQESQRPRIKPPREERERAPELEAKQEQAPAVEPEQAPPAAPAVEPEAPSAAVSGGEWDDVRVDALVYRNPATRKSLSVHHLQRRLVELGHVAAGADRDGWYGDVTRDAVREFQVTRGVGAGDGLMDAETARAVFDGDRSVRVVE